MNSFKYTNILAIVAATFMIAHVAGCEMVEVPLAQSEPQDDTTADSDAGESEDSDSVDTPKDVTPAVVDKDEDGDGFTTKIDCDDDNVNVNPAAKETCNFIDDNCDGETDEGVKEWVFDDIDGDGFGNPASGHVVCDPKASPKWVSNSGDCNDSTKVVDGKVQGYFINPGMAEVCSDGIDNDCNGKTDEGVTYYLDSDEDGYGNIMEKIVVCGEKVKAGYILDNTDCNDSHNDDYPGASERCDGVDNDCDGLYDESFYNVGEPCQPESGEEDGVYVCSDDGLTEWCKPLPADPDPTPDPDPAPAPDDATPVNDTFVPFVELAVWWPKESTATISYQVYSNADEIGSKWDDEAKTVYYSDSPGEGFVKIVVKGLDLGVCGIRFNVAFGDPANSWLCYDGKLKNGTYTALSYFGEPEKPGKLLFTEDQAIVWTSPKSGGCSVIFANKTSGKCALD
jgi:hypothetical protein